MNTLKISHATKFFNDKIVLQDINFECSTKDVVGIYGKNGVGKSTLLKMIYGVLPAEKINVTYNQKNIDPKEGIEKQLIGYLPQHSFLPKELTVKNLIPMFFEQEEKQDAIFYAPRIPSMVNKKAGVLSKGELRYLEVLLIGHLKHPFLLLDEPFSSIEPQFKTLIKSFLKTLKKAKGIVITDHAYQDVFELATKHFVIKDTTAYAFNTIDELTALGYTNKKIS